MVVVSAAIAHLYPDEEELEQELKGLDEAEGHAVEAIRAEFASKRDSARENFHARMLEARRQEVELAARLEAERVAREEARRREDELAKQAELERIRVEYEQQRTRDEAAQAEEQARLGAELERQRAAKQAQHPASSAPSSNFESRQYRFAPGVDEAFRSLKRPAPGTRTLVLRIEHDEGTLEIDGEFDGESLDDVAADMSEAVPRYVLHTFPWARADGRTQYPLALVTVMPRAVPAQLRVMYSRPISELRDHLGVSRAFTCEDVEDLGQAWLEEQLEGRR